MDESTAQRLANLLEEQKVGVDHDVLVPNPWDGRKTYGVGVLLRCTAEDDGDAENGPHLNLIPESLIEIDFIPDEAGHFGTWHAKLFVCGDGVEVEEHEQTYDPPTPDASLIFHFTDVTDTSIEFVASKLSTVLKSFVPSNT